MLSSLDDLNIKLYMQLKSAIPTLFFKLSEIAIYLLHKSFKLRLCAIQCDCNIDICALTFQDFLYRHFYRTKYYDGMRPVSNQPARFLAPAKTHKFDTIEDINVKDLKLRPIIDQSGTFIYDVSVNNRLLKQIDACLMGGPISVVFADIYMCKMEDDVVAPLKLISYKRYVDDTYVRKKKNTTDKLFENFNIYHDNIKLTIEENPTMFLDT